MTKSQMIREISRKTGQTQSQVENVLNCFSDTVIETLAKNETVTITGLGRFEMRARKAKSFTNPKTMQKTNLAPRHSPGFKMSGTMRQQIAALAK